MSKLGQKLATFLMAYRERKGLSQLHLAEQIGFSRISVVRWEKAQDAGGVRLNELEQILSKTGYTLFEVFGDEGAGMSRLTLESIQQQLDMGRAQEAELKLLQGIKKSTHRDQKARK